jgi:hypothetical protein
LPSDASRDASPYPAVEYRYAYIVAHSAGGLPCVRSALPPRSPIPKRYQWRAWAEDPEGITGEELMAFGATGPALPALIDFDFQNHVTAYIAACCRANASRVALPTVTETVLGIATARHCTVQGIESPPLIWV